MVYLIKKRTKFCLEVGLFLWLLLTRRICHASFSLLPTFVIAFSWLSWWLVIRATCQISLFSAAASGIRLLSTLKWRRMRSSSWWRLSLGRWRWLSNIGSEGIILRRKRSAVVSLSAVTSSGFTHKMNLRLK